ncbi:MAG: hypothetical protein ACRDX8_13635 [Acidimicrobiales bacterium]
MVGWGVPVADLSLKQLRRRRQRIQVIFQHPPVSFDLRFTVERIIPAAVPTCVGV